MQSVVISLSENRLTIALRLRQIFDPRVFMRNSNDVWQSLKINVLRTTPTTSSPPPTMITNN